MNVHDILTEHYGTKNKPHIILLSNPLNSGLRIRLGKTACTPNKRKDVLFQFHYQFSNELPSESNNLLYHWHLFIENGGNFEVIISKLTVLQWDLGKIESKLINKNQN